MTLVMSYVILIAAGIGATAFLAETVLRTRRKPGRWVWVGALTLTVLATMLAMIVPHASDTISSDRLLELPISVVGQSTVTAPQAVTPSRVIEMAFGVSDTTLPLVWLIATTALLIAIGIGRHRLRRERIRAERAQLAGHRVLLTEDVGPAVAGIREPVVFVPRWVLALDDPSQRLLMAHEMEHVNRRDTALLFAGAVSAAIMPWNPVVWWMVGRLRLAVEQDCDARVLAVHPEVRRYADLLLTAASRHGLKSRLLAAHLGEHTSDLFRRIEAMTSKDKLSWRKLTVAAFVAAALVAVACETPRPDPVAPVNLTNGKASSASATDTVEIRKARSESKYTVYVRSSEGKELARYAGEIPVAHLPPDGIQSMKGEEEQCGSEKCFSVWITLKPGRTLNDVTELAKLPYKVEGAQVLSPDREFEVPEVEFRKGETVMLMKGAKLKATGESLLPGPVELSGSTEVLAAKVEERKGILTANNEEVLDSRPARIILRDGSKVLDELPNILIMSSDGTELKRILAGTWTPSSKSPIDDISSDDIKEIDVVKARNCAPVACPLIRITLKAGREAAYRKR